MLLAPIFSRQTRQYHNSNNILTEKYLYRTRKYYLAFKVIYYYYIGRR